MSVKAADLARLGAHLLSDPAITALINNAGRGNFSPFAKLSSQTIDETIAVNITALTRLTHAVLPCFLAGGTGCILNIASGLALYPRPEFGHYGASKACVMSFSQAIPGEVAD